MEEGEAGRAAVSWLAGVGVCAWMRRRDDTLDGRHAWGLEKAELFQLFRQLHSVYLSSR